MKAIDAVKPQDLPRSKDEQMQDLIVAFDVDGTLIRNVKAKGRRYGIPHNDDVPIVHNVNMLQVLSRAKNVSIVVWSGGGARYAREWGVRLGLDDFVWRYASKLAYLELREICDILIAFDDIHASALGHVNIIVREK